LGESRISISVGHGRPRAGSTGEIPCSRVGA
jgi:hypothetical protein